MMIVFTRSLRDCCPDQCKPSQMKRHFYFQPVMQIDIMSPFHLLLDSNTGFPCVFAKGILHVKREVRRSESFSDYYLRDR